MLITNFAAGELSETLFGRTDLSQYYSGAARIENFDVIPTGGLKRRGGMERLVKLVKGDGRIIPFIVNRALGFLLHLTPLEITVYKVENGNLSAGQTSTSNYNANEINEVQYAQNFDTMIMCHENHPPLEVKLINNGLNIRQLVLSFKKTVVAGEGTEDEKYLYVNDDDEYNNGRLSQEENYPAAVSFFNGRLIFAATKKERQRLFVSSIKKANEEYNFSTNKVFLTEKKEYVVVRGTVTGQADIIVVKDKETPLEFTKKISSYVVDSTFFDPGTRILEIFGDTIRLSSNSTIRPTLNQGELDALNQWKAQANTAMDLLEDDDSSIGIGRPYTPHGGGGNGTHYDPLFKMNCAVTKLRVNANGNYYQPISSANAAEILNMTQAAARTYLNDILRPWLNSVADALLSGCVFSYSHNSTERIGWETARDLIYNQIHSYWQYQIRDKTFFGTPDEIYLDVMEYYNQGTDVYIPFYTREIITDEYPTPDCGFTFEIASDANDAIRWLAVNKGLIVGTETGEWIIPPGVHATNIQATLNSRYGSDKIQGTAVGDATCFFQTGKKALVEYYIPQQDNNFRANNMAMLAMQILSESPAKDFDFISSPHTKLLVTREDGTIAALLYERGTGTFAWARISTDSGEIKCAAVLPGPDGNDDAYLIVKRGDDFFLERLREDCRVYLDSYRQWNGDRSDYSDEAIVYDGRIGYRYTSRVKSMPILANNQMKPNNIKNLLVRFLDSYMPELKSYPNDAVDTIGCVHGEPYTGVYKVMFPGVWDNDVMFEFIHDKPNRCSILAINAEVN